MAKTKIGRGRLAPKVQGQISASTRSWHSLCNNVSTVASPLALTILGAGEEHLHPNVAQLGPDPWESKGPKQPEQIQWRNRDTDADDEDKLTPPKNNMPSWNRQHYSEMPPQLPTRKHDCACQKLQPLCPNNLNAGNTYRRANCNKFANMPTATT